MKAHKEQRPRIEHAKAQPEQKQDELHTHLCQGIAQLYFPGVERRRKLAPAPGDIAHHPTDKGYAHTIYICMRVCVWNNHNTHGTHQKYGYSQVYYWY